MTPIDLPAAPRPWATGFHPAVIDWFDRRFTAATEAQQRAWPALRAGRDTLVAAPTGSGKTLTAFLAAIDELVWRGLGAGGLPDETVVVYVSPLKALSNDIRLNLESPLAGIAAELARQGLPDVQIRTAVRTGDTPARERAQALRRPPHILVTTPESLYVLLGSDSGRRMLRTVRHVIVDEIHAIAGGKRGSHLSLTLARLDALTEQRATRIGLSATQKPIDEVARFLVGTDRVAADGRADCEVIDIGYARSRDLAIELPQLPLEAVMSNEQWTQVYARVAELAWLHRTTLVFVNTRRMAERAARQLGDILGRDAVAAHHGSLSRETRLAAEQRLKRGELRLLVATASLELGLDIGEIDLVCQLGSPRSIATFLQRAGRSGHHVGGTPRARLFAQTRDELVECAALLDAVQRGELDALRIPLAPIDVLAQQIVAETACREWQEDALFELVRRAWPYRALTREHFDDVVRMLSDGFSTAQGSRGHLVHRDGIHHRLRERRGARMTALTSGGTIPEVGDYAVVLEPQAETIGSVHEDFAVESLAGDVFQLGNRSYRIQRIETGRVRVEDAQGAAPNIPFWLGEAPGRSDELSFAVSRLRSDVQQQLEAGGAARASAELQARLGLGVDAASQLVAHLASGLAALGQLPTQQCIVLERFFDASGGMQLVVHSPFGSRLNRAWGLALRKRFCRRFNFELQAAATEDAIVLSLSQSHSFPLEEVARYLHPASAREVLVQAVLEAPLFAVRWRWNATTALALPRFSGGRKVAPQLQRMRSEDLLASVFPDQVACAENLAGDREVPAHPLVEQTLHDCLEEAMDASGWLALLERMHSGEVQVVARDLPAPSALAMEAIQARPYAFLDDAPLEERRTLAVQNRRYGDASDVQAMGELDAQAIDDVREQAWPQPRSADEMHEALLSIGFVRPHEVPRWQDGQGWLDALAAASRARRVRLGSSKDAPTFWLAAESVGAWLGLHPEARCQPAGPSRSKAAAAASEDVPALLSDFLRARLSALGPVDLASLARDFELPAARIEAALLDLQQQGHVLQGRFTPQVGEVEWCERHLLARIHRYTLGRLRREIEPVAVRDYMRFLFEWQHLSEGTRLSGPRALDALVSQLEGIEAPAPAWEAELLPARMTDFSPAWLDELCTSGRAMWMRLRPTAAGARGAVGAVSLHAAPILVLPRRSSALWQALAWPGDASRSDASPGDSSPGDASRSLGARARAVDSFLALHGASFFDDIAAGTRLLPSEVEDALSELVARGRARCDSFAGLRALLVPPSRRSKGVGRHGQRRQAAGVADAGRWTLVRPPPGEAADARKPGEEEVEAVAWVLLRRYGLVCWRLLEREASFLPPWRDLLRVLRRMEARGEVRGGRFVAGITGEQFALPEAITALRRVRQRAHAQEWVVIGAVDPANLLGSVVTGHRLARVVGTRIAWLDGMPVAALVQGELAWLTEVPDELRRQAQERLAARTASRDLGMSRVEALILEAREAKVAKAALDGPAGR